MIGRAILISLALAAPIQLARAQDLPSFQFREFVAGTDLTEARIDGCPRKAGKDEKRECSSFMTEMAGIRLDYFSATIWRGRLTDIYGTFHSDFYHRIVDALRAKYGEPCETETEEIQTRMGVKAQGAVVRWCFATGKLAADQYSGSLLKSSILYADQIQPPKDAPKVDF